MHRVTTFVSSEEEAAGLEIWEQGDEGMYTEENLTGRARLRFDARVTTALEMWWEVARTSYEGDARAESIGFEPYEAMLKRCLTLLAFMLAFPRSFTFPFSFPFSFSPPPTCFTLLLATLLLPPSFHPPPIFPPSTLLRRLYRVCLKTYDDEEAAKSIRADWDDDRKGADRLNRAALFDA